jgi:hypothetical protein
MKFYKILYSLLGWGYCFRDIVDVTKFVSDFR